MANQATTPLRGRRILVVEDDYFLALMAEDALLRGGAEVIGPLPTLQEGLDFLASGSPLDGALLDVQLRTSLVWPLAEALLARGVPVAFVTDLPTDRFPPRLTDLPRCGKFLYPGEVSRALFGPDGEASAGTAA